MRKNKVWILLGVRLSKVPSKHRAANGNCQFTVLVKAPTKKRVAELLDADLRSLNYFGFHDTDTPQHVEICQKPETIYYHMENHNPAAGDDFGKWLEYVPTAS